MAPKKNFRKAFVGIVMDMALALPMYANVNVLPGQGWWANVYICWCWGGLVFLRVIATNTDVYPAGYPQFSDPDLYKSWCSGISQMPAH
ncbi:Uncharacterised protein [Raoultella terrigena]|uniref:Uncharacterized protein n=1 Tax=Raoultella terrigena TaxID=577 RepID=A0A3P8KEH1_RAOTE|nr:Uncharacterised protein [Raoultella terrigena]